MGVKKQIDRITNEVSTQKKIIYEIQEVLKQKGVYFSNLPFTLNQSILGLSGENLSPFGTPIEVNTKLLEDILNKLKDW